MADFGGLPAYGFKKQTKTVGNTGDLTVLTNVAQNVVLNSGNLVDFRFNNTGPDEKVLRIYNEPAAGVTIASDRPFQEVRIRSGEMIRPEDGTLFRNCTNRQGFSIAVTQEMFDGSNATAPVPTITGEIDYREFVL